MGCTVKDPATTPPLAYHLTLQIGVDDQKPQAQSVDVLPGKAAELRFDTLSTPLVVQLSAAAGNWPHDVNVTTQFRGATPELNMQWEQAQTLGVPQEVTAKTGSPPTQYRFVVTADAATGAH